MRGSIAGLIGLLVVLAGCGGGEEHRVASAKHEGTTGGGERAAAVIEVEESALRAPARVEIVEMTPVPVPAPLGEPSGVASGKQPDTPSARAEAQGELQMDEPSMGEYEPGAQARIGIEEEETWRGDLESESELGMEAPRGDTPMAELVIEEDVAISGAEEASSLCPTDIEGLRVTSSNTRNGARLTLTTSRESEVHELRARMRQLATLLDRERAEEACAPGEESAGMPSAEPASHFVERDSAIHRVRDIRLIDVPNGVRIEFVGDRGERELIDALHTQVSEDARSLREGLCPLSFQTI